MSDLRDILRQTNRRTNVLTDGQGRLPWTPSGEPGVQKTFKVLPSKILPITYFKTKMIQQHIILLNILQKNAPWYWFYVDIVLF